MRTHTETRAQKLARLYPTLTTEEGERAVELLVCLFQLAARYRARQEHAVSGHHSNGYVGEGGVSQEPQRHD